MLGGLFTTNTGYVGIDFGSQSVKMLQLQRAGSDFQVIGAARINRPSASESIVSDDNLDADGYGHPAERASDDDAAAGGLNASSVDLSEPWPELTEQLAGAVRSGFAGRRCMVCLPRSAVYMQPLRLPRMSEQELSQAVVWEASERFGFSRDAMEVEYIRTSLAGDVGESREEVLLIAASHEVIHRWLDPVLQAGFRPVGVEVDVPALARLFSRKHRRLSDREHARVVLDVGYSGSSIIILRGDQVAFCKRMKIGGAQFNQAVANHLQMDLESVAQLRNSRLETEARSLNSSEQASDATCQQCGIVIEPETDRSMYQAVRPLLGDLARELMLCLRYFSVTYRGRPPERIIITGGDGLEPGLNRTIAQHTKIQTEFDDEMHTLASLNAGLQRKMQRDPWMITSWSVAAGLSMRAVERNRVEQRSPQSKPKTRPAPSSGTRPPLQGAGTGGKEAA